MDMSNTPWSSSSQADYYDEQCQRATILDHQAGTTPKERYGFPVREPDGTLNGRGVHAAAGRSSGVSPEAASVSRARSSPDTTTVLADRYQRKRVNSPNDGVCRWDGTAFFTDPSFGLPAEDPKRALRWSVRHTQRKACASQRRASRTQRPGVGTR